jgi:hypothetical protein
MHPGTLAPWHPGILAPWHPGMNLCTLAPWHPGTLRGFKTNVFSYQGSPRFSRDPHPNESMHPGTLAPWHPGILASWHPGMNLCTLAPWHPRGSNRFISTLRSLATENKGFLIGAPAGQLDSFRSRIFMAAWAWGFPCRRGESAETGMGFCPKGLLDSSQPPQRSPRFIPASPRVF